MSTRTPRNTTHVKSTESPKVELSATDLKNEQVLVTRRRFLYGAIGVGAVAVVGVGAAVAGAHSDDNEITYLEAPDDALTPLTDLEVLKSAFSHLGAVRSPQFSKRPLAPKKGPRYMTYAPPRKAPSGPKPMCSKAPGGCTAPFSRTAHS